jgi:cellulose synthase/poly-beta-1,6-N-acetylglucosamine synthase-like glycosyltransferase
MLLTPIYLLVLLVFMNRYVAGKLLERVLRHRFRQAKEPEDQGMPTVTVVVPLYNEGESIYRTILSLLEQDYPSHLLSVIVIDDCSKDDSYFWACRAEREQPGRVRVIRNAVNLGKRRGINRAVREARSELIVSVDSDVIVERDAVRLLVRRFTSPQIAAVGGMVEVSNPNDNWLTRMQTIKYYFGYVYLKSVERAFRSVMCLSGCLTAYRRSVLLDLEPILERRSVLGVAIKYGEDRFLTRQIVKAGYQTRLTLDAKCRTKAPTTLDKYFAQQLRWRRSNLVDYMMGLSHAWRLHPAVAVHYLSLFALLLAYPLIVASNLADGTFWHLSTLHLGVLALFGVMYGLDTRGLPAERRVHPLWFVCLGAIMPVTYLLHTVLALFTLDSGSWETRGHVASPDPKGDEARAELSLGLGASAARES